MKTQVATLDTTAAFTTPQQSNPFGPLLDPQSYDMMIKISRVFAESNLVPNHFHNRPADVFVTLQLAWRLNLDPMTALQSVYVVSGRPGLSASLVIALANRSGIFKGPITYDKKGDGDSLSVTASTVLAATGKTVSAEVDMKLATAEKWTKNAKYQTMPEHMLIYRAATWLVRRYCPEVLLGMQTTEELHDITAAATVERIHDPVAFDIDPICKAIDDAKTLADLAKVGKSIAEANGNITVEQKQGLRARYARQKAVLSESVDIETGEILPAALPEIPEALLDTWTALRDEIAGGNQQDALEALAGLNPEHQAILRPHVEQAGGGNG